MSRAKPLLTLRLRDNSSGPAEPELAGLLAGLLDFAYRRERREPACLDLLLADDAEMARLNRRHLGRDEPTDVLAFEDGDCDEDGEGKTHLGDVAIGAETARRLAAGRGVKPIDELAFYALHGLLHLLGRIDGGGGDRAAMLREQLDLMREYGIGVSEDML
ncbi:MAG: rRNA maturation RNase YbeY [Planctomycetota bacterium]|jgi:probable rRNA maturation factor|nr:rRNA maturation RNase YbeY [Planctomycetota bacterium]